MKRPRNRRGLVVQHLEDIPGGALRRFPDVIRELVHGRNGVYALYSDDRLYYVGLARNLRSRLKSHLRDRHAEEWDRFSIYLTKNDEHIKELESLVLRIAEPRGNRITGKLAGSQDLRPVLKRSIRRHQRQEMEEFAGFAQPERKQRVSRAVRRLEDREFDTIVCPAHEDGFKETFLGERCWYAIRISDRVIPRLKYIAIYVTGKVGQVSYYGRIKAIEPWKRSGKYIVRLVGKPKTIGPIPWRKGVVIQSPRLTTFKKLRSASTLAGAF